MRFSIDVIPDFFFVSGVVQYGNHWYSINSVRKCCSDLCFFNLTSHGDLTYSEFCSLLSGMMTGQILGGTSVTQAARYQILITYLIATCTFGTILSQAWLTCRVCFDSRIMLRTDRLLKTTKKKSCLSTVLLPLLGRFFVASNKDVSTSTEEASFLAPRGELAVKTSQEEQSESKENIIEVSSLSFAFDKDENAGASAQQRILFQNINFRLGRSEKALVDGPRYVVMIVRLQNKHSETHDFLFPKRCWQEYSPSNCSRFSTCLGGRYFTLWKVSS
jgi:hypothetical protein